MLIWINGAFGVGKTHTAHELRRRLQTAHVADPELLGGAIHKMLPPDQRADYQDRPQWRTGVRETLLQACSATEVPVIVPMTLVDPDYFEEIVGRLRGAGIDVRHYALTAPVDVIHGRLRTRIGYAVGRLTGIRETWAMERADRCVRALRDDRFATHVPTGRRPLDEVVEHIAADLDLPLPAPRLNRVRSQLRRAEVGLRHIRM